MILHASAAVCLLFPMYLCIHVLWFTLHIYSLSDLLTKSLNEWAKHVPVELHTCINVLRFTFSVEYENDASRISVIHY